MQKNASKPIYGEYSRKSSESEDRQALSIESQLDVVRNLAKNLNARVSTKHIFSESKSAKVTGNRLEYTRMLQTIESGEINSIIVWHADRLSRNAIDTALLIDLLDRERLIEIVTPTQTFRNTPIDKFMLSLACSQAKMENDKKGIDVKRGLEKKARLGMFPGPAPFGYLNDKYAERGNRKINSDPERLPLIKKMFELMLMGSYAPLKIREIATNEWGYRTPEGTKLGRSTIYRILSNPFYFGAFEYPLKSGTWYRGNHETIITEEEFDRVQYLLGKKGRPRPKRHVFDFLGVMKCGECGGAITAELKIKKQQNGNTHRYIYYHCTKHLKPECSQGCLEETELKKQVITEIDSLEIPPEFHTFAMKWLKEKNKEQAETVKTVVNAQQKAYNACVRKIEGLTDMRAGGEIGAEEFAERKEKVLAEKEKLGQQFKNNDERINQWIETGDQMFTFIEKAQQKFNTGLPEVKRGILSTLGSNLVIKDKRVSVDIEKSILPLRRISKDVMKLKKRLEPLNNEDKQAQFEQSCIENPVVLRDLESNQNFRFQRATAYR